MTPSDKTEPSTGEELPIHTSATRSHLPAAHSERKSQPMKHNASTLGRRAAAAAGVLTLAFLGLAPSAVATETPNYGNIKTEVKGSLVIHKHLTGGGTDIGTPTGPAQNPGNKGPAVEGVVFTAYPITDINLKDPAGWDTISDLARTGVPDSACTNPAAPTLGTHTFGKGMASPATNSEGLATITEMPVQAYLVCETTTPGDIVQKAKPFVVTIPHPNTAAGADGQWIYDVNVYPKNEAIDVDKTIQAQKLNGYGVGSLIKFPVSSTAPTLDAKSFYKYFQLKDTLDERLSEVTATEVSLEGTTLQPTDYQVATNGQTVTVTFTAEGLKKIKAAPGKKVSAVFQGKVTKAGNGTITNRAQVISDTVYAEQPPTPVTPPTDPENPPTSEDVTSRWGDLSIKKVDTHQQGQTKAGLQGAQFQLYKAKDAYANTCSKVKDGDPIAINGQTTLTTDAQGAIDIKGLFISDSIDGADRDNQKDAQERCYVLVETKAPAGYVLPAGDAAVTAVKVKVGEETTDNVTIENTKQSVPGLPLTGANGMLILTASGASLLMIAVGSVLVARYRERKQNANLAL